MAVPVAPIRMIPGQTKMNRTLWIVLLGLVPLAALVTLAALQSARHSDVLALGAQVYATNCASCHGARGEGGNPAAPLQRDTNGLYPAPPHDNTGHTWHHPDALIKDIITNGSSYPDFQSPMPAWGDKLTEAEIDAVIAYIRTWWTDEQRQFQEQVSRQNQP